MVKRNAIATRLTKRRTQTQKRAFDVAVRGKKKPPIQGDAAQVKRWDCGRVDVHAVPEVAPDRHQEDGDEELVMLLMYIGGDDGRSDIAENSGNNESSDVYSHCETEVPLPSDLDGCLWSYVEVFDHK